MSYTLYGSPRSRTFRVIWLLEELGVAYDHVPAKPQSDELRAVSPLGKIPVLRDGDSVIPDSSAILTYLADKHGALTFPAGTIDRARQDAWTFRVLDEVEGLLWTAARHSFILPEEARVPDIKPACRAEYAHNIARIAAELPGPYLMGDTFTIADIVLTHCLTWAMNAKFPEAPPRLAAYLETCRARPAYQAAQSQS
ncbi:glutathione S-transferase family protein [Thalassococcus sp. CAU 1522]|uniref:Glutathione S-transferase family protein n=1 Tax=Thalassococcus arenae TaxID=2851652 RepID=A0ABS6N4C6_9RHOB|nr:glutathione S-transferase family protein [Thalassococcus arenae]MBV2358871.1 glutathione S-transferase family protein [Thalassococcus arenae]